SKKRWRRRTTVPLRPRAVRGPLAMPAPLPAVETVLALPTLPARRPDSNKGTFGRILVVAGSRGMSGAAALCGTAALRAGAGLVTVAVPQSAWQVVAGTNPCLLTAP